ncbi:MAG: hypothetical protein ACR2JH_11390 [Solirubrobacteraceae bacterium]
MAEVMMEERAGRITIPAAYLEDVRRALAAEIDNDADWIKASEDHAEDREGAVRHLRTDLGLLDSVLAADESTELAADPHGLFHMLEAFIRLLTERLTQEIDYAPISMGPVIEILGRLQWAADEALRLFPEA